MPQPHNETSDGGLTHDDRRRLDALFEQVRQKIETFVGFPANAVFDYSPLFRFLQFPLNNVGDAFAPTELHLHTHAFEREVIETVGRLTGAPEGGCWGYVTSGGTEGNLYGIFLARELFPEGVVYYSEDTHYSVAKILRCLRVRNIMIKSACDGRIDLDDLRETLKIHRDVPPIIFANVGTTMTGAVDDLPAIVDILDRLAIHQRYIHADAALSGMVLPFVDGAVAWDFRAGVDSLAISGHKMIGSPVPCGVVLARREHVQRIARSVEYVGTLDTTILGSRSALAPLILWYAIRTVGPERFRRRVRQCLETAEYATTRLREIGLDAWRHEHSLTVVFPRPDDDLVQRWHLAVEGDRAHLITMPHVGRGHIDRLVADLQESPH